MKEKRASSSHVESLMTEYKNLKNGCSKSC